MNPLVRLVTVTAALLGVGSPVLAQVVIQPEQCILDTLKGSAPKESLMMVQRNCVRQYIKAVESKAVAINPAAFQVGALWFAPLAGFPNPTQERILITIKNDSQGIIVAANVLVARKSGKAQQSYRAYAEEPIWPGTLGRLEANIMTGSPDFFKEYNWALSSVFIVMND